MSKGKKHELIGAIITDIREMTNEEHEALFGWEMNGFNTPTVYQLTLPTGGKMGLIAFADEEGNGPGSFVMMDDQMGTFYADYWTTQTAFAPDAE